MLISSFARGARSAAVLAVLAIAVPCAAQRAGATHESPAARLAPDSIVAFARLSLSVAQARDSIQRLLAQPRNETPQAQQQLRDQLITQVADILRHAGMSSEEFRRRTFVVSTDSAARAVYDQTIAKLTGAPLPGQLPATTASAVKVPAGQVGVHIGHVMNAFADAPKGQGLLSTATAEARIALIHAVLAARDPANLDGMKVHAGHVINAVDPSVVATGPGLGYGVKRAALGVATHIDLAAKVPGASPNVITHANHVGTSARNTVKRADEIVALARRIQSAGSAAEAAPLMSELVSLTNELAAGKDANGDGRVSWQDGEGGLQQCEEHMKLMLAAEPSTAVRD